MRDMDKEQVKSGDLAHQMPSPFMPYPQNGYTSSPRTQILLNDQIKLYPWNNLWSASDTLAGAINLLEPA